MNDTTPNDAMRLVTDDASRPGVEAVTDGNGKDRGESHHDVERLGTRIKHLHHVLSDLADKKDFKALLSMIHKPGYTSVAEFALVSGLVEAMNEQANTLAGIKKLVTSASHTIIGD